MRNLDIATLRSLQAVAEYGAVTRAAEALNMTQSALSMQIKRLDDLFGESMLQKQGRGVVLTDFATELLIEARKLVALNDAILSRFTGQRPEARLRAARKLPPTERRALDILEAKDSWTKQEIRKQYKSLVKDLHPDMNGGDRSDEDRLQEVVWAWDQIKDSRSFKD